jgi:hypothetical protein
MEPIKSTIDPRAQIKQSGKIDCIREFNDLPKMNITFSYEKYFSFDLFSQFVRLVIIIFHKELIRHFHCISINSSKKLKWIQIISFFDGEISKSKDSFIFQPLSLYLL